MMGALEEKFHVGRNLTFAFIDSWAKHPANLGDQNQQVAFARETGILWNFALNSEEFVFKSIQDVLDENQKLKAEVEYLNENIDQILEQLVGINSTLASHQSKIDDDESRITSNENKLSAQNTTLHDILENVDDFKTKIFSHQTSIDELKNSTRNLDLLPLGTILSYHPKNGDTFPVGWLPCDGGNIFKGPLAGQKTPGNPT
jgi:hypothetical protein